MYADHFRHGDLLPVWSSLNAFHMGTPFPLFYHKTFYFVSASLYLVLGAMKLSIVLAIAVFMFAGAYGMRAATHELTGRRLLAFSAPVVLLLANYTFTDWLIRGAMAELTAMMLVPWLLWWCLRLVRRGTWSWWIVPIYFLLFNAHNALTMYATVPLAIAGTVFLVKERRRGLAAVWRPALLSAGGIVVLLVPLFVVQWGFLDDYNPGKVTQAGYKASERFREFSTYFVNSDFRWLRDAHKFTTQIDYGIWLPLALFVVAGAAAVALRHRPAMSVVGRVMFSPAGAFLVVTATVMLMLQCSFTRPLYQAVSILEFLQFPWRLLAFITPLGILLVAHVAGNLRVLGRRVMLVLALCWVATFAVLSPLHHDFQYNFYPQQRIDLATAPSPTAANMGIGEYLPRVAVDGHEMPSVEVMAAYEAMYTKRRQTEVIRGSCTIRALRRTSLDPRTLSYRIACTQPSTVALPISYSRFHRVRVKAAGEAAVRTFRDRSDPRLMVDLPGRDGMLVVVRLPSMASVLRQLLIPR
ncbi:hypothetical protein ACFQX7_08090 [Luedemannella flava]